MKKTIFISLVFYILFSSSLYAQINSIKIRGNLTSDYEGKHVRVNTQKNGKFLYSYSSSVKDSTFHIEIDDCASCDTLAKFLIGNNPDDEFAIYLDAESIRVYTDLGKIKVTGTEFNDQYQQYRDSNEYYSKVLAPTLAKMEGTASYTFDTRTEEFRLMKDWGKFRYHFIEKNIKNPVGIFIFENVGRSWPILLYKGDSAIINLYNLADERIKSAPYAIDWKEYSEKTAQERIQKKNSLGTKITDLNVLTLNGNSKKISNIISNSKSKYFILDFWASWCGPCIAAMPTLEEIYKKYHNEGLEIIGISIDEDTLSWEKKLKQINTPWINLKFDKSKISIDDLKREFNFGPIPYLILLDKSGKIVSILGTDRERLESVLNIYFK